MPKASRIITAVEIGSSKVVALMGEVTENEQALNIIGFGICPSQGVSKGTITDLKLAGDCVHAAIENAERNAGNVRSEAVFLALSGAHVGGFHNEAVVAIQGSGGAVSQADIASVVEQSRQRRPQDDHAVVHYIQGPFLVDGKPVDDPHRLRGKHLGATCWIAHARTSQLANSISIINGFNLKVSDVILASLGSAAAVTTREERKAGVLVVDIGAGTTDFVLYRSGVVAATGVIAVGGQHLTNDLSLALRCNFAQAENLKRRCGRANVVCKDKAEKVYLLGEKGLGDRQISLHAVEKVCALRVEELFQILKKRLGTVLVPDSVNMGVVLTGGSSQLAGIEQVASETLGLPARRGEHDGRLVSGDLLQPDYSSVLGVLQYGLYDTAAKLATRRSAGLFQSVLKSLKLA